MSSLCPACEDYSQPAAPHPSHTTHILTGDAGQPGESPWLELAPAHFASQFLTLYFACLPLGYFLAPARACHPPLLPPKQVLGHQVFGGLVLPFPSPAIPFPLSCGLTQPLSLLRSSQLPLALHVKASRVLSHHSIMWQGHVPQLCHSMPNMSQLGLLPETTYFRTLRAYSSNPEVRPASGQQGMGLGRAEARQGSSQRLEAVWREGWVGTMQPLDQRFSNLVILRPHKIIYSFTRSPPPPPYN